MRCHICGEELIIINDPIIVGSNTTILIACPLSLFGCDHVWFHVGVE